MPKLIIVEKGLERTFEITKDVTTLGRSGNNDIKIDDPKASRNHCTIALTPDEGGYTLVDKGSSNGTRLNGKAVNRELLAIGDKVTIGSINIFFNQKMDAQEEDDLEIPDEDLRIDASPHAQTPIPELEELSPTPVPELPPEPVVPEIPLAARFSKVPDIGDALLEEELAPFVLIGLAGEVKGSEFPIKEKITFGRKKSLDVVLEDEKVSGLHASIEIEGGEYFLVDDNSTNGTYADEKKITRMKLSHGSTFRMGRTEFAFKNQHLPLPAAEEAAAMPSEDPNMPSQAAFESVDLAPVLEKEQNLVSIIAGTLLTLLLVVIIIAGFIVVRGLLKKETLPSMAGNLIHENWSFEEGIGRRQSPGWNVEAASSWDIDRAAGSHGKCSLALGKTGEVSYANIIPLDSVGRDIVVYAAADIKVDGDDTAGALKLTFTSTSDLSFREERWTTLAVEGRGEFRKVSAAVPIPRKATACRLACVHLRGSGTVNFDAIELFSITGKIEDAKEAYPDFSGDEIERIFNTAEEARKAEGELSLTGSVDVAFSGKGTFGVTRRGSRILWGAGVFAIEPGSGDTPASFQGLATMKTPLAEREDGSLEVEARIYSLDARARYRVYELVRPGANRVTVDYILSVPGAAGSGAAFGLRFFTTERLWNAASVSADEIVWGEKEKRVSLSWSSTGEKPSVTGHGDEIVSVTLPLKTVMTPKGRFAASLEIGRSSVREKKLFEDDFARIENLRAMDLLSDARDMARNVKRRAVGEPAQIKRAEAVIKAINESEAQMRSDLLKMKGDINSFGNYRILPIFASYAASAAKSFPDTLGPEAAGMLMDMENSRNRLESTLANSEASKLLHKAALHLAKKKYALAEAAYREITIRFAGTATAKKAVDKLSVIKAHHDALEKSRKANDKLRP